MTAINDHSSVPSGAETCTVSMAMPSSIVSCGLVGNSSNTLENKTGNILLGWCASSHHLSVISKTASKKNNITVSSYTCRPGSSLANVAVDATSNLIWTLQSDDVLTCWHHNQQNAIELSGPNDEKKAHLLHSYTLDKKRYKSWQNPLTTTMTVDGVKQPFWINFASLADTTRKKSKKNGFELVVATTANQQGQVLSLKQKNNHRNLMLEAIPFTIPGFKPLHDEIMNSWINVSEETYTTSQSSNQRKRKFTKKESIKMNIQLQIIILKKGGSKLQYCSCIVSCPYSAIGSQNNQGKNNIWSCENILVQDIQIPFCQNDCSKDDRSPDFLKVAKWKTKNCFAFVHQLSDSDETQSDGTSPDTFQCTLLNIPPSQSESFMKENKQLESVEHLTLTKPTESSQLEGIQTLLDDLLVVHWCETDGGESIIDMYHTKRCVLLSRNHYSGESDVTFCKTNHATSMALMDSKKVIFVDSFITPSSSNKLSLAQSLAKMNTQLFQPQITKCNDLEQLFKNGDIQIACEETLKQQKKAITDLQKYRNVHSAKKLNLWEVFNKSIETLMENGKNPGESSDSPNLTNGTSKKKVKVNPSSIEMMDRAACEDLPNVFFETAVSVAMDVILSSEMVCRRLKKQQKDEEFFRIQQACASQVLIECLRLKDLSARVHIMAELSHRHHFKQNGPLLALLLSLRNLKNFKWSKPKKESYDCAKTPLEIIRSMILYCPNLTEHMIVVMIRYIICYSDEAELNADMVKYQSWYEQYSETFHESKLSEATENDTASSGSKKKILSRCKLFWTFVILCLREKETSAPNPALLRSAFVHQRMCKREVMTWLQLLSNILKHAVASVTLKYPGSTKLVIQLISALMDAHIGVLLEISMVENDKDDDDDDEKSEFTEIEMKELKKEVKNSIIMAKSQAEVVLELKTLLQSVDVHLNNNINLITGVGLLHSFSKKDARNGYDVTMAELSRGCLDEKPLSHDPIPMYSLERLIF